MKLLALRWSIFVLALICLAGCSYHIRAWMLADGKGLVYNPGERVEGYTTFLWIVLLSLCYRIGLSTVVLSRVLGMAFAVASLAFLAWSDRISGQMESRVSILSTLLLGTSATFLIWGMSGMETSMVAFLVLATSLVFVRSTATEDRRLDLLVGLLGGLAAMSRPDAALLVATLGAARLLEYVWHRRPGWLRLTVGFTVVYLPYFLWRVDYYGWLLPNTFYAKVGATSSQLARGGRYFLDWAGASVLLLIPVLLAPLLWRRIDRRHRPPAALLSFLAVHTLYVIAVGGDIMPAFRFFAPILPVLSLCTAWLVVGLVRRRSAVWVLAILIASFNLWQVPRNPNYLVWIQKVHVAQRGRQTGLFLRQAVPPDTLLATNNAGAVPYYSRLPVIDMLGLNDVEIAHTQVENMGAGFAGHEKANGAYVLSRQPDLILFGSARGARAPRFRSDQELFALPEFHEQYRFVNVRMPNGGRLRVYERNDRSLLESGGGE